MKRLPRLHELIRSGSNRWLVKSAVTKAISHSRFNFIEKIASRTFNVSFLPVDSEKPRDLIALNPLTLKILTVTIKKVGQKMVRFNNNDLKGTENKVMKDDFNHTFTKLENGIAFSAENETGHIILRTKYEIYLK
jgi:hypothetical protein